MPYLILAYIFIFGAIIGSFLNCLVWRLHTEESMLNRSYCPRCKEKIAWYDNIPIFSFLILRGRCRHCNKKISWQYPVVEFATGFLFVLSYMFINSEPIILNYKLIILNFQAWLLISVMIIIFIYDLRWYLILDKVTLPSVLIFFILNLYLGLSWSNMLLSGLLGAGFFLFQFMISQGKWIGGGDVRLGLLMGIALGKLSYLMTAIFIGYIIGSIVGIALILGGKKALGSKLPLGVFLSLASVITLLWGDILIKWYFNLF